MISGFRHNVVQDEISTLVGQYYAEEWNFLTDVSGNVRKVLALYGCVISHNSAHLTIFLHHPALLKKKKLVGLMDTFFIQSQLNVVYKILKTIFTVSSF